MSNWSLTGIQLAPGANALNLLGYDLKGNLVDSDSITVTSTTGPLDPPQITSLNPSSAQALTNIEIFGNDFHNGVRVFFGAVESASVTYDENGPTPNKIVARVPAGSGTVAVTARNFDNQSSNGMSFTYVPPPPMFIRGDVNNDGIVDISDGFKIILHLYGSVAVDCQDALDTNDDEQLNNTDAVYMLNYLFLNGPVIRPPFPAAGTDPSGAALGCSR
jgi:hypothetical protein